MFAGQSRTLCPRVSSNKFPDLSISLPDVGILVGIKMDLNTHTHTHTHDTHTHAYTHTHVHIYKHKHMIREINVRE